ncbi:hypothetical protein M413DRAFT_32494 [Hebeloma cylindrosporum]|uniref:Uncharacterized protein n=1 Tax=Hebeloma cylindrosporum TaxID=76867 RepID=A0A0C3BVN4_HEBCY|nr:hypothetical protein M413DRAFT_32494 [Hebeloma cylindrosporum h7]
MFISKIFLVLFALLFSSALAAPLLVGSALRSPARIERSLDDPQLSTRGFAHIVQAARIAGQIKRKVRPTPGKAVFWTGRIPHPNKSHDPVSVQGSTEKWAKAKGKEVLEPTLKMHGIHIPSQDHNPYAPKLWNIASQVYAQRASGHVHAIVGTELRDGNTYQKIEKPELMNNNKVTKITEHNAATGGTTVVK